MIYLEKNSINEMYTEAQALNTTGFYLWRFFSTQYKTDSVLYLTPSESSERFASFQITLPDDVDLSKIGKYHYFVYDGDGVSTDFENMTLLENGQMTLSE